MTLACPALAVRRSAAASSERPRYVLRDMSVAFAARDPGAAGLRAFATSTRRTFDILAAWCSTSSSRWR